MVIGLKGLQQVYNESKIKKNLPLNLLLFIILLLKIRVCPSSTPETKAGLILVVGSLNP